MIILEGMDNSGKSTLGKLIGLPIVNPGGKPKDEAQENLMMSEQLMLALLGSDVVQDRVTCISQQVYRGRVGDARYGGFAERMLCGYKVFLIYCRPPTDVIMDFSGHVIKDYEDPADVDRVMRSAHHLITSYDKLMSKLPHIRYDYTNCRTEQFVAWLRDSQTNWRAR
jgi:hypothetical protein